jgi:tryptophan-rich sensory protein
MRNKDNYILGLTIGAVLPLLSFFGYYYWKFSLFTFSELLSQNKSLVTALSIPCLLLNIVLFTIFINGRKDKTAKGIFIASIIYALSALLFKFLF